MDFFAFFTGDGVDDYGRHIDTILGMSFTELEYCHDYIQRIFPLKDVSRADPTAPLYTDEDIEKIKESYHAQLCIIRSFYKMLDFYGLDTNHIEGKIFRGRDFWIRRYEWICQRNHNYMRISRILLSLKLVGLDYLAEMFFDCLKELYKQYKFEIGVEAFGCWEDAVKG